jgi:hypothetical protein
MAGASDRLRWAVDTLGADLVVAELANGPAAGVVGHLVAS